MGLTTTSCVVITCDGCGEPHQHEDWGTPHFVTAAEARSRLVDDYADEPEYRWTVSEDLSTWICPTCTAAQICKDAGGHDWSSWDVYGDNAFRTCRRGACTASERRPIEEATL